MPFKSKAQRRKFAQLLVEGEITPEVFEEWNRETGGAHLPERVGTKKPRKSSRPRRKQKTTRAATPRKKKVSRAGTRRNSARKKRAGTARRARR